HPLAAPQHNAAVTPRGPPRQPLLESFVRLLRYDDGGIYQSADGDSDSPQRHHIERKAQKMERHEDRQHSERYGEDRDGRTRRVPEKQQDDRHDGERDLQQRGTQITYDAMNRLGAMIDRDNVNSGRKSGGDLQKLAFDQFDGTVHARALSHDDDPGDRFAAAVKVGHATPYLRTDGDSSHVLQAH